MTITAAPWVTRKAIGDAWEMQVAEELRQRGWEVTAWGQGLLGKATQGALSGTESPFRYEPDLIAARGPDVLLLDCKSRLSPSSRHAIKRDALRAALRRVAETQLPLYYVLDTYRVLTPHDVLIYDTGSDHLRVRDSGAGAYVLVGSSYARKFDVVFGDKTVVSGPGVAA